MNASTAAPVRIRVYPYRLNLWNPAVLPDGWTVETALGEQPSAPHNPVVAGAFFRRGDIETWGRGIRLIFEACRAAVGAAETKTTPEVAGEVTGEVGRLISVLKDQTLRRAEMQSLLTLKGRPTSGIVIPCPPSPPASSK